MLAKSRGNLTAHQGLQRPVANTFRVIGFIQVFPCRITLLLVRHHSRTQAGGDCFRLALSACTLGDVSLAMRQLPGKGETPGVLGKDSEAALAFRGMDTALVHVLLPVEGDGG